MDILLLAIIALVVFVVARSFTQYEKTNQSSQNQSSTSEQSQTAQNSQAEQGAKMQRKPEPQEDPQTMQIEVGIVIALMARLSKADGKICMLEEELVQFCFKDFSQPFENPAQIETILRQIFEDERHSEEDNLDDLATQFYQLNRYAYTKRVKVLQHLVNLAFIDKVLSSSEEAILEKVATLFKISKDDFEQLLGSFSKYYSKHSNDEISDINLAYELLDSKPSDTIDQVKAKYRALVKKYHPDLLHSKGFEDDYVQDCTRKLQNINTAFELIKAHRK